MHPRLISGDTFLNLTWILLNIKFKNGRIKIKNIFGATAKKYIK
jgi:hypothetical protein